MGNCHTVGPNEMMVISGGCCSNTKTYITGGWGWAWWCCTDVQNLTLEIITLRPTCQGVETAEGVKVQVTGIAQVKVMKEMEFLEKACEQFLGKSRREIQQVVLQTLEGHLRAILGTLTVEEAFQDRDKLAIEVRKIASPDVGRMGIEIVSFVIKDISDKVDYLSSLGRAQTGVVKRDARIGVAEASRDAGIREAECEKTRLDTKYEADSHVANHERGYRMNQAQFDQEVNTKKADAELAYELAAAKVQQNIRSEEIEIDVVERRKLIDVEEKEILRKEKELNATVRLPAEAEAFKVEQIAEGRRRQRVAEAHGAAEQVRLIGESQALSIEAVGKAEAERMRLKASAYKQYGDAAMVSLILKTLPLLAAEVAAPLSKIGEIVMIGDDQTSTEVSKLVSQLPPAVQALTGVDLSGVLKQLPGAKSSK